MAFIFLWCWTQALVQVFMIYIKPNIMNKATQHGQKLLDTKFQEVLFSSEVSNCSHTSTTWQNPFLNDFQYTNITSITTRYPIQNQNFLITKPKIYIGFIKCMSSHWHQLFKHHQDFPVSDLHCAHIKST